MRIATLFPYIAWLLLVVAAAAQTPPHFDWQGADLALVGAAEEVANVGDVNGDGFTDFIVGSRSFTYTLQAQGAAAIISGATTRTFSCTGGQVVANPPAYSILYGYLGAAAGDHAGWDVAGGGDHDGDGVPDFIIGAPGVNSAPGQIFGTGQAIVVSGATGVVMHVLDQTSTTLGTVFAFGVDVAALGDLNNDGCDEIAVGAPGSNMGDGSVHVFDGASGAELLFTTNPQSGGLGLFGWVVAPLRGDADGDGTEDLIVGAYNNAGGRGEAFIVSGAGGSIIRTHTGSNPAGSISCPSGPGPATVSYPGDELGWDVASIGDLGSDGVPEYIIGERSTHIPGPPGMPPAAVGAGRATVHDGTTGATLAVFSGSEGVPPCTFDPTPATSEVGARFGAYVDGGHDFNSDGVPDFVVGEYRRTASGVPASRYPGAFYVYSGATFTLLRAGPVTPAQGPAPGPGVQVEATRFGVHDELLGEAVAIIPQGADYPLIAVSEGPSVIKSYQLFGVQSFDNVTANARTPKLTWTPGASLRPLGSLRVVTPNPGTSARFLFSLEVAPCSGQQANPLVVDLGANLLESVSVTLTGGGAKIAYDLREASVRARHGTHPVVSALLTGASPPLASLQGLNIFVQVLDSANEASNLLRLQVED